MKRIEGGILAAKGFTASGVACGIKPSGAKDLALLVADRLCVAAATLTTNRLRAAPTYVTQEHLRTGTARALVACSGIANAATGAEGMRRARRQAELAAEALGIAAEDVLVFSTGKIGPQLPMDRLERGIRTAVLKLTRKGADDAAEAIMTTDTHSKQCAVEFPIGKATVRLGGMAKGAGMIEPNMATMGCFLTTDARIAHPMLQRALSYAVQRSFNSITVDGDMSTNDTVCIFASAEAGNAIVSRPGKGFDAFQEALTYVATDLAKQIARDGEGATKLIEVRVTGARTDGEAQLVAKKVANSPLVKTAAYGRDWNWGRIAAAVGAAPLPIDPQRVTIALANIVGFEYGEPVDPQPSIGRDEMSGEELSIAVDLGSGSGEATVWTCDLTEGYIRENAEYST